MSDDKNQNSNSQSGQSSSSGSKSNISSTYVKCSDPRSKFSVHSAEANRQIAESRAGYISKFGDKGGSKGNKR